MNKIQKILIANRGEIAIRIMKAAKSLNVKSVAIYSEDDSNSAHINIADENYSLGKGSLEETYLNVPRIIEIAKQSNCEAIHPGYGFLAENNEFAKQCDENNIIFIGPSADIIKKMGDKIIARDFVKNAGVNIIVGIEGEVNDILVKSSELKFPLLVKAASGGGGKGMRVVNEKTELEPALVACSREAKSYFGNGTVYVEKYLTNPRHIEVQILGDKHGNVIHLFERECSIQRRYQKIIEESPAVVLSDETRTNICNDAVKIAKAANYENAGTIEFLHGENEEYYFLEMNTRVQVEHPVTETVTGVDIVAEQIKIADGQPLSYKQTDIEQSGHAIECRIYAEDSENNFIPSPGKICFYREPQNEFVRVDSSLIEANEIKSNFDPMISKVIVKGENRQEAIHNMLSALDDYHIHGIKTNIKFLKAILADKSFQQNKISTKYCENVFIPQYHPSDKVEDPEHFIIAGLLYSILQKSKPKNVWEEIGYWRACSRISVKLNNNEYQIGLVEKRQNIFVITIVKEVYNIKVAKSEPNFIAYSCNGKGYDFVISKDDEERYFISNKGDVITFERNDILKGNNKISSNITTDNNIVLKSTMPGKVIKILVTEGQKVSKDDELLIVESMKMENSYYAKEDTIIEKINVNVNDNITADSELIIFGKNNEE